MSFNCLVVQQISVLVICKKVFHESSCSLLVVYEIFLFGRFNHLVIQGILLFFPSFVFLFWKDLCLLCFALIIYVGFVL
jgi:hypothetical protein